MKHEFLKDRGGKGLDGWIKPTCSCGWEGSKHYASNDYQSVNALEQWNRHVKAAEEYKVSADS